MSKDFSPFMGTIEKDFFQHPVIQNNSYTKWLKKGEINTPQLKDLITQWGVFSNHFLVVQCKRMVNARTEEAERGARWILANEIGVGLDVEHGTCDSKTFFTKNAHINWLRELAGMINLEPRTVGAWEHGTEATHRFLQMLDETYGSHDENIGAGASFAIESWAAFGIGKGPELESNNFWQEHIHGLKAYNEKKYIEGGKKALEAIYTFWLGLDQSRKPLA